MTYSPELCQFGNKSILSSKGWIFEPKMDGTRFILYKNGNEIKLINRRNNNITPRYPELKEIYRQINAKSCVLDGELVVYDKKGNPNFNLLQHREQLSNKLLIDIRSKQTPATLIVFDILEKNGKRLTDIPLLERKKILNETVKENEKIQPIVYTYEGKKLWNAVKKKYLEGIVAKKTNSEYESGVRSEDWLKLKFLKTADVVLVGYLSEKRNISSLCMAVYFKKKLRYIGRVGTGFTQNFLDELHEKMRKLKVKRPPVYNPSTNPGITWVKPELVGEVEYLEVTKYVELRAPSFKRLRFDKEPKQCTWEDQLRFTAYKK